MIQQPVMFQSYDQGIKQLKTYLIVQLSKSSRVVYSMDGGNLSKKDFSEIISQDAGCKPLTDINSLIIHPTKASSFLDINGDCQPDFIIESQNVITGRDYLEIYLYKKGKYCLVDVQSVAPKTLMSTLADLRKADNLTP